MANSQFIILLDGSYYKPMYEHMLLELSEMRDVTFIVDYQCVGRIKELLLKRKVQYISKGKLDFLAYEENQLFQSIKYYSERKDNVYVIFLNAALYFNPYLPGTLRRYKKKFKNLRYILFYLDIMNVSVSRNADILYKQNIFDIVYTIDKNDAFRSGAVLWNTFYSVNKSYFGIQPEVDLYFCGVSKGRDNILTECALTAKKYKINVSMDVIYYDDSDIFASNIYGINVRTPNEYLNYQEVIKNELRARCILEVVQKGQVALTLRSYEAVVYNRKLLTNNKSIFEFPYYSSQYMRYFEKVEDIDWEWIKDSGDIDYEYKGEYSPIHLLNDIRNRLEGIE